MAEKARRAWSEASGAWIDGMRRGDVNREFLLDQPTLTACGEVSGLAILDVGCGEGRFCRKLSELGARTTGLDVTPEFIAEARRLHPGGSYVEASAESMPFESGSFDLAVSYLTLIDIPDYRSAIAEVARVLRPSGRFVVANIHSFASTHERAWSRDAEGKKLHVAVNDYYDERAHFLDWDDIRIYNWHRPFENYLQPMFANGLVMTQFSEPRPTPEAVAAHPSMMDEYKVPLFYVMTLRKEG